MIYKIGNQKLTIIDSETKEDKGTPHQVVSWRDMAETCRTLDAVCNYIPVKDSPIIVDGIARAGFWGALFRNKWPNCILHLNEKEKNCLDVLKRNFPNDKITNFNIEKWAPKKCDIAMLDFDDFTLHKADKWKSILQAWEKSCTYLIIVDSACFGFKFGNLRHYGKIDEKDYYYLLNKYFKSISLNKRVTTVCKFTNAATILLKEKKVSKIKFISPSSDLFLSKGDVPKGLLF
jgi:hypothetical protein